MKTPTLTEARRAMLEVQQVINAESMTGGKLSVIRQYLDSQVSLNVEKANFVFCTSDSNALKPETNDRRFVTMIAPAQRAATTPPAASVQSYESGYTDGYVKATAEHAKREPCNEPDIGRDAAQAEQQHD